MKQHIHNEYFIFRPIAATLLLILVLFAIAGCGDGEPDQRKAFAAFLNEKVVSQKGVALPELSRQERKSFGEYTAHYEILTAFQAAMTREAGKNARELLALADFEDLAAMAKAERSLKKAAREAEGMQKSVAALREKTDRAKGKLSLPEDLAPSYDAAYEKVVTLPAAASSTAFAAANEAVGAILDLLDFINTNNRDVEIDGKNINLKNPGLREPLQTRLATVHEKTALLRKANVDMMQTMLQ